MNKTALLVFACVFLFVACNNGSTNEKQKNIEIGTSQEKICAKDIWSSAQVITMDEDSVNVLGTVSQIRRNSHYYVMMNDMSDLLSVFDLDGNSVATFNRQGNAHNEYLTILDFDITEDSIYVLCEPNSKIIVADMKGRVHRVIDTDKDFTSLACYGGNLFGYTEEDRTLYVLHDGVWKQIISEGELPSCPVACTTFFKTDGKLFYFPEGGDRMYEVDGNNAEVLFTIDYPDKEKIEARMKENRMYETKERIQLCPPEVESFVNTNDSYIMTYSFRGVVRACVLGKENLDLQKEGFWYFSSYPEISDDSSCLFAEFISKDDMPIDTTQIKVGYTREPDWENGQLAIIKYLNE